MIRTHIARITARYAQHKAARKLQRITDAKRVSFDCEQYRRRRAAALRGLGR